MRRHSWTALLFLATLVRAQDPPPKTSAPRADIVVGTVQTIEGTWCRRGKGQAATKELKASDELHLLDDVQFCDPSFKNTDHLTIHFLRQPPYDRDYSCATPGICDSHAKLWLFGPYYYGPSDTPQGSTPISPPTVASSVRPDIVIVAGSVPQPSGSASAAPGWSGFKTWGMLPRPASLLICKRQFSLKKLEESTSYRFGDCEPYLQSKPYPVGSYGIFSETDRTHPLLIMGVVPPGSDAINEWQSIPSQVRTATDRRTVEERRAYVLDLTAQAMQENLQRSDAGPSAKVADSDTAILDDDAILLLQRSGVSKASLIQIIGEANKSRFDLSPSEVSRMIRAGVPVEVLSAMAAKGSVSGATAK